MPASRFAQLFALCALLVGADTAVAQPADQSSPDSSGPDAANASPQTLGSRMLTAEMALADARLARRALETIHPGYDRYTPAPSLAQQWDRFEARCVPGISERDFFAELSLILGSIRCSHTKAEPAPAWVDARASVPTYLPFRFVLRGSAMVVTAVPPQTTDSSASGLRVGDEILAIAFKPVSTILERILPAIPADGFTDEARRFALSSVSDLDDSEFDHFLPFFHPLSSPVTLDVRSPGSPARQITVGLVTRAERNRLLALPPTPSNFDEAVTLSFPDSNIALLRVSTFVAYRKQISPEEVLRPFFEQIAQRNPRTLILDLRDNGGGSDNAAIDLARFLSSAPITVGAKKPWVKAYRFPDLRPHLSTWDQAALDAPDELFRPLENGCFELQSSPQTFEPLSPAFTGRLIVLCGPANASGATLFLAGLRARRPDTIFFGGQTGGSIDGPTAGIILFLTLPNSGIRVRIPGLRSFSGIDPPELGRGFAPDVVVDWDGISSEDPVLARALDLARAAAR